MTKQTLHLMWDLETLSTENNANVISIGGVFFFMEGTEGNLVYKEKQKFKYNIKIEQEKENNFHIKRDTVEWWLGKPTNAIQQAFLNHVSPRDVLVELKYMIDMYKENYNIMTWGNADSFDTEILLHLYKVYDVTFPIKYYERSCYRSICNYKKAFLGKAFPQRNQLGVFHNSVDDAVSQAKHLVEVLNTK